VTTRTAAAAAGLRDTVEQLCRSSRRTATDPYGAVEWPPAVDPDRDWFFVPSLSSLYGTAHWDALGETGQRRLVFFEAVNFFSLNIHGERALMEGIASRLYRSDLIEVADYLHHFLDEENKHSVYFGGFCRRYARIYPSRQVAVPEDVPREDADFLFFARVLLFEEIVDRYNLIQANDADLHPLARWINHNHHAEETRHLIFGRRLVEALWEAHRESWGAERRGEIGRYLNQFLAMTWREYYNPDVYRDCGLADPYAVARSAWAAPAQRSHRRRLSERCVRFLIDRGITTEEPADAF
jgi:hypothetical protein